VLAAKHDAHRAAAKLGGDCVVAQRFADHPRTVGNVCPPQENRESPYELRSQVVGARRRRRFPDPGSWTFTNAPESGKMGE
jgi:hypothetical protein